MSKNQLEKQSHGSLTGGSSSLGEDPLEPPSLVPRPTASASNPASASDQLEPNASRTEALADAVKDPYYLLDNGIIEDDLCPCDYGEPMRPQRLLLDFTPIYGVDDNASKLKKVLDFWKFIDSIPGLDNLRASPDGQGESEAGEDISLEESETDELEKSGTVLNSESALPWMKRDHMTSTAFVARQRGRHCEQGGGDYFSSQPHATTRRTSSKLQTSHLNFTCKRHSEDARASPHTEAHELCKQMEEWEHFHPSPLEPPARTPNRGYNDAVLQRKT